MTAHDRRSRLLACALAFQAGFVDALGFLALKGYFVSFMSGNSTRLGVDLAGRSGAAWPAGLIACFVIGVIVGSATRRIAVRRPTAMVLSITAFALIAAATSFAFGVERVAIGWMVLAMGAENAALERPGKGSLGVTYVTGALVKVGQQIAALFFGGDRLAWLWDALLWAALVAGGVLGALAWPHWSLASLWIPAIVAVALAGIAFTMSFDPAAGAGAAR